MTWSILFGLILQFIGPYIAKILVKLLEKWFKKTERQITDIDPNALPPQAAVEKLFEEMETVLPKFAPARKLMLRIIKRVIVPRAKEFFEKKDVALVTPLSVDEQAELRHISVLAIKE